MLLGPASSGIAGMVTREGTDDDIGGEEFRGCKDVSKCIKICSPYMLIAHPQSIHMDSAFRSGPVFSTFFKKLELRLVNNFPIFYITGTGPRHIGQQRSVTFS
jgi:hypothetical protein